MAHDTTVLLLLRQARGVFVQAGLDVLRLLLLLLLLRVWMRRALAPLV
jgi:hypothetical protein